MLKSMDYEITPIEFATKLRLSQSSSQLNPAEKPILLDVREPWEHQTAHVAGSLLIPMGDIPTRAHAELDPEAHIVVMCHHGVRSMSVTVWLRDQGFERVQSLAGGIEEWSRTVDSGVPRY